MARKQTTKARRASLRNLAKAHAARKGKTHTKRARSRARSSESPKKRRPRRRARRMRVKEAPKRHRRRARRMSAETPKRKRRRRRRHAAEAPKRVRRRRHRRASDWKGQPRRHRKAAKKGWRARRKPTHPHHKKKVRRKRVGKKNNKGRTRAQTAASRRNIRKAQAARRSGKAGVAKHYQSSVRPPSHVVTYAAAERRRGRGRGRRRSNPLEPMELFFSIFSGVTGFLAADLLDRWAATHALTDKGTKDASGNELYADNPPTTGQYVGLFNPTAIAAPMTWQRAAWGVLPGLALMGGSAFIKKPKGRAFAQTFAFAWLVRIVGKAAIDGVAYLGRNTQLGQQFYDGELRAAVLKANNGNSQAAALASLPSAGLGKPQIGNGKPAGAGSCAECAAKAAAANGGVGYPSMPREVSPAASAPAPMPPPQPQNPGSQMQPPPAPPPALPPPPPGANLTTTLTGTRGVAAPRRRFNWGDKDS